MHFNDFFYSISLTFYDDLAWCWIYPLLLWYWMFVYQCNIFYLNLLFSVPVSLDLLDGRSRHKCCSHMNFFTPSFRVVWRINTIPKKEWEFILHLPWSFVYIYYDQHFGKLNLVHNGGNSEINGRVSLKV